MTSCFCDSTVIYISKLPDLKPVDWMRACLVVIVCLFVYFVAESTDAQMHQR